ncbi:WW domain-containing protein [Heracleum sosnowskyi]|uniref:WW domain-containing protein n=1 Tax=Heracleum sosnowskyi TaxID=360622 RepID=A0AAD8JE19_9APIA|nr:WW domain-containing protein [Heracleum sosnowskyi]
MVCIPKDLSQTRKEVMEEFEGSSRKRKLEVSQPDETLGRPYKERNLMKPKFDIKKSLREAPLPLEWQRCLDIKSGQLYFYNTRTHKRTYSDPRISAEPPSDSSCMSLDLQLNLNYGSVGKKYDEDDRGSSKSSKLSDDRLVDLHGDNYTSSLKRYPSWLTIEGDQREMVTAVCKKCHMLVIMCKSYPTCPNCKFLHPQN